MSIELHCTKCRKLIRAPDSAGGKHGKCPHCAERVYIPTPPDDSQILSIMPLDEKEEREAEEMRRESIAFASAVGHTKDSSNPESSKASTEVNVANEIKSFVLAMHASKLGQAEAASTHLKSVKKNARIQLKEMLGSNSPPQYGDVPAGLVQGFLKNLLDRL